MPRSRRRHGGGCTKRDSNQQHRLHQVAVEGSAMTTHRQCMSACFEHMQYFWIAVDPGRCCKSIVSVVQHARASIVSPAPNCLSPRQAKPISPYRHWGACKWAAGLASEGTCRVSELTKLRISTLVRLLSHRNREQTDAAKDMSVCLVKDPRSSDSCTRRERALYFDMLQSMRHG